MNSVGEHATVSQQPMRRCALTREVRPERDLLRFVVDADGAICFDLKRKLPGRGVWITASKGAVAEARRRGAFQRALRRNVSVPEDLPERVEQMLRRAALSALSLANKAGQVVAGFAKVASCLEKNRVTALVHAVEAAPDGCRRLDSRFRASAGAKAMLHRPVFRLPLEGLSQATGRENVNHAALLHGGAAEGFIAAASRLCQFTGDGVVGAADRRQAKLAPAPTGLAEQDTE